MASRSWMAWMIVAAASLVGCGSGDGEPDAGPALVDQCLSTADRDVIASIVPVAPDAGSDAGVDAGAPVDPVPGWLTACTTGGGDCMAVTIGGSDEDVRTCMHECLAPTPLGDLSVGCRTCYIDTVTCARHNCVVDCLGNDNVACVACTTEHCNPLYDVCRGL